jgi:hypothetical protein
MSSNLTLNVEIVEKTINKKTWKKKQQQKKRMRLKFGKKKPNKNEIWEKNIANQKNYN